MKVRKVKIFQMYFVFSKAQIVFCSAEGAVIEVFTTTNGHFKVKIRFISGKYDVRGAINHLITLNLKKNT